LGDDAINYTAKGIKMPSFSDFYQNFTFYLADNKFITGHIERHDDGFYGAGCSVINEVESPLPKTYNRTIICHSGTTAEMAFEEIVKQVIKDTRVPNLRLSMIANASEEKHLSVSDEKKVLNQYFAPREIVVLEFKDQ